MPRSRLIALPVVAVYVWLVNRFWFVCDDAFITFRYSKNWAEGNGLRYNLGDHDPVEGYSNFLWMAGAAVVEWVGGSPAATMPWISAACGLVLLLYVPWTLRRYFEASTLVAGLAAATLAASPAYATWSTSGLATMPLMLALFATFERLVLCGDRHAWRGAALAGVVLSLVRTEGIAWFSVLVVLAGVASWDDSPSRRKERWRTLARATGLVVAVYLLYFGLRYLHFGTMLANTATAKVGMSVDRLERGAHYVGAYYLTFLAPIAYFAGVIPAMRRHRGRAVALCAIAVAFPVYGVVVGGDFMTMGRLVVPSLPFSALLFGCLLRDLRRPLARIVVGVGLCVLGMLPALDITLAPQAWRDALHFRLNTTQVRTEYQQWMFMNGNTRRWSALGRALAQVGKPGDSYVAGAIGAVGYHSGLFMYDQFGLVTRKVAMLPAPTGPLRHSPGHDKSVRPGFFLPERPTYLYAGRVQGRGASARLAREVASWRPSKKTKQRYVPDVFALEEDGEAVYIAVLRHHRPDEVANEVWAAWPSRLAELP